MLPRYQPPTNTTQKPLSNEILALNKLLGTDILEQAARILDHYVSTKEDKLESFSLRTPTQLTDKLMEKCEDFETVCDQIYYTLEQTKRVLQLEYQQKIIQQKVESLEQEKQQLTDAEQQQQQQQQLENDPMNVDMEFEPSQMSLSLDEHKPMMETDSHNMNNNTNANQNQAKNLNTNGTDPAATIDEEDMEELLQIQRDRLERLKNVIVFGMDAETANAKGGNQDEEDLLF